MTYVAAQDSLDGFAKVIYESKDGKTSKTFEALDWLVRRRRNNPYPEPWRVRRRRIRYYG